MPRIGTGLRLVFLFTIAVSGCTERHFPITQTPEDGKKFRADINFCVGHFDPDQLASVNSGTEYNVSGSISADSNRAKVVDCMTQRGWPAIPIVLGP